ncbi:hypothetical protein ACEQUB_00222 [Ralstonia syzygii]|uniref:Transposase n=1 Tax=Ralstonia syzygii R24 TaxID=907261 RepID=G3A406_9RALS|nr:conserved hypothetical protein [Ralstonia syzygii R24]
MLCLGKHLERGVYDILDKRVMVQIADRSELHTFRVMPQRWAVERGFAWLEKNRRLWKNCEREHTRDTTDAELADLLSGYSSKFQVGFS